MRQGTLSRRLILLTSIWAVISIGLAAFLLSQAYRANSERRFEELVTANLYILMGAVEPGEDGRLTGQPDLRDPRFLNFGSGWNWVVSSVSDPVEPAGFCLAGRWRCCPARRASNSTTGSSEAGPM